jgi:hypothetical protein
MSKDTTNTYLLLYLVFARLHPKVGAIAQVRRTRQIDLSYATLAKVSRNIGVLIDRGEN